MTSETQPLEIKLNNYYLLLGVVVYFVNSIADKTINIPVGEFALFGLLLSQYYLKKRILNDSTAYITAALAIAMIVWCTLVDYYHNGTTYGAIRIFSRLFILYGIIMLYILLPDKRNIIYFVTGLMLGHIINFFGFLVYYFGIVHTDFYRLKYLIPTPSVVMLYFLIFKSNFSTILRWVFPVCLIVSFASLPLIGGRGAFLSLFLAGTFYGIYATKIISRSVMVYIVMLVPAITVIIVGFYGRDILQYLFEINYATISNVERILMLETSIEIMRDYPIFGKSLKEFTSMYHDEFTALTSIEFTALSPHNFYMETAVPYGVPAFVVLLIIWRNIYHLMYRSLKMDGKKTAFGAYATFSIGWIMLYQPVAGITRLDLMILLIVSLYGMNSANLSRKRVDSYYA